MINRYLAYLIVDVLPDEAHALKSLILELNSEQNCAVVVEGKRDSLALKSMGYSQKVLEFHSFGGITKFADSVVCHDSVILLFDSDRKGRYLTRRVIEQLGRRTRVNLHYKRRISKITNGKIRAIEEMARYGQMFHSMSY